jgi:hypothetical protein
MPHPVNRRQMPGWKQTRRPLPPLSRQGQPGKNGRRSAGKGKPPKRTP